MSEGMSPSQALAEYLAAEMERRGLSARTVAAYSGLSATTVTNLLKGWGDPRPATLRKLAAGLGVPYEELLEQAGILDGMPGEGEADSAAAELRAIYRRMEADLDRWLGEGRELLARYRCEISAGHGRRATSPPPARRAPGESAG